MINSEPNPSRNAITVLVIRYVSFSVIVAVFAFLFYART
jgi:hypothetical protein